MPRLAPYCLAVCVWLFTSGAYAQTAPAVAAPAAPIVSVKPAREVFVYPQHEASGSVVARNESKLAAEIAAPILVVNADVGSVVKRGTLLVRLDATDYQLALDRVMAQKEALAPKLDLAERQLARAKELREQNFISTEAVNQREADVLNWRAEAKGLDSQIATARRQIQKTSILAPFDGVVKERNAQLGELASVGTPLVVLTQTGTPEISVAIPAAVVAGLPRANGWTFEISGQIPPEQVAVKLLRISPVVNRETRKQEARFAFVGASRPPGTEGRLLWNEPGAHLPGDLVVRRGDKLGVFVVDAGKAKFVPMAGAQEGRPVANGLAVEARVVVVGQAALQDGQAVTVAASK